MALASNIYRPFTARGVRPRGVGDEGLVRKDVNVGDRCDKHLDADQEILQACRGEG